MTTAIYQGTLLAESDHCIVVEGHHYFPPAAVNHRHLVPSDRRTTCHWKGIASYYHVTVGADLRRDAAWYYPDPSPAAELIKDHIAFGNDVEIRA